MASVTALDSVYLFICFNSLDQLDFVSPVIPSFSVQHAPRHFAPCVEMAVCKCVCFCWGFSVSKSGHVLIQFNTDSHHVTGATLNLAFR